MEKSKKSREEVQKKKLDFYIFNQIKNEIMPAQIVKNSGLSKQKVNYYLDKLRALGLIKKVSYSIWEVTRQLNELQFKEVQKKRKSKLFSGGTSDRPRSDLHALQIKIPILSGKIDDKDWVVKENLRNWTPKYTKLTELGGLDIKNNNNKSLTIFAKNREVRKTDEVRKFVHAILIYLGSYFKTKYGVSLDTINAEVKNLDLATEDKAAEGKRGNGDKYTKNLNKKCQKILPNDNRDAYAWIDGTPYIFSAETNDLDWYEAYIDMPFNIKNLLYSLPALAEYNKNLRLHLSVMEDIRATERENLKTQKAIQKALERLGR